MAHITLRTLEKEDIPFIHKLFNDPAIMSYWFEEAYHSKGTLEESFDKNKESPHTRSFIIDHAGEDIGLVQLLFIDTISRNAEFAIMIDPQHQGKGYSHLATQQAIDYAFQTLNLHKLYLWADETNEKAIHIYKKHGFTVDAVLHEHFYVNGSYRNTVIMNIFQRDYYANQS
ncbi:MAG TPA: GNAT family N-acetyltransferase [Bacillota bacterium]|nr:GNAT family N-acetyltransferase [Bacillota bacterium]